MLIAAFVVGVLALLLALVAYAKPRYGPPLVGKTVVVHTKDDQTIRGVMHGHYVDRLSLREAAVVLPGGQERPLGGFEHVPIGNVRFVQELEPKGA